MENTNFAPKILIFIHTKNSSPKNAFLKNQTAKLQDPGSNLIESPGYLKSHFLKLMQICFIFILGSTDKCYGYGLMENSLPKVISKLFPP